MLSRVLIILFGLVAAAPPSQSDQPVVIYLHGRIVEEQGPNAVSTEFGPYLYNAILDSLRSSGYQVWADLRPSGTDPDQYAERVANQLDSLIHAGVAPHRISVIGFSKGGGIAIRASARLGRRDVGFVFLAACSNAPAMSQVVGRILSVFEASDSLGRSCRPLFDAAKPGTIHEEVRIETGLRHGAFYQPRAAWLQPVRAWIEKGSS
jgi:hypothetical protein